MAFASIEVCPLRSPPTVEEAMEMIVVGLDVHKQSVTAVAVDAHADVDPGLGVALSRPNDLADRFEA